MKNFFALAFSLVIATATAAHAGAPKAVTSLKKALAQAKAEGKMLFVQMGREGCGNCAALKGMIQSGEVTLEAEKFVYADVDVDDAKTDQLFSSKFKVEGNMLPFVAIANADGTQLAGRTGYGTAKEFQKLLRDADKKARKMAAASAPSAAVATAPAQKKK